MEYDQKLKGVTSKKDNREIWRSERRKTMEIETKKGKKRGKKLMGGEIMVRWIYTKGVVFMGFVEKC